MCDRERGVGSDGVVVQTPGDDGTLHVDFRNPDGSRSFCGNGTRSAVAWAQGEGVFDKDIRVPSMAPMPGCFVPTARPGISPQRGGCAQRERPLGAQALHAAFLNTGSPHHVEWVDSASGLDGLDLARGGLSGTPPF